MNQRMIDVTQKMSGGWAENAPLLATGVVAVPHEPTGATEVVFFNTSRQLTMRPLESLVTSVCFPRPGSGGMRTGGFVACRFCGGGGNRSDVTTGCGT